MVKSRGHSGFTLIELLIGISIMSIVMIGAFMVVTGTIESQNKLEKIISKGFTHLTYSGKGFPLHPPNLRFVSRPGWFRVPSAFAVNPSAAEVTHTASNRTVSLTLIQSDLAFDTPTWYQCEGDGTIRIKCSPFVNGVSSIDIELNTTKVPSAAIVRFRTQWPSLPQGHPNKYSPEYTISIPYVQDCDFPPLDPTAPKFLQHTGSYRTSTPPEINGKCERNWTNYVCLNGVITPKPYKKACL